MTKGKPYDFWNKNAMAYEVESLEKKNDQLLKDNKRIDELEWKNSKLQREVLDLQKKYEDLKKETEPDIQKELEFWDRHNGKLLTE
tara:strand:+ start:369 stop:626 length:258 start_codon:yes stop_codon:yes gene_type:complete